MSKLFDTSNINAMQLSNRFVRSATWEGMAAEDGSCTFLMNQFFSPAFNKRTDDYGGSIENRARALLETLRKIRTAVGNDYPIVF